MLGVRGRWQVARTRHRWRRRVLVVAAAVVIMPVAAVAAMWPMTPGVGNAEQLVRARAAAQHAVELAALPSPDRVGQALIATEDSRFYATPGIDPISAARAAVAMLRGSGDTGAATLEQQLVKNLYVARDTGIAAKVQEAELAVKLDVRYSKDEVLRLYLAEVYFGHGFYGLPAAARGYFGVAPAALSWAQASMLAGLVLAPSAFDPLHDLPAARARERHVLNRLVATHVLSSAQADAAFAAPLGLT
jgi:membrane peptidoglycan carboxypeptidase